MTDPTGTDVPSRIVAAYQALASEPEEFVSIAALRDQLPDLPREQVDAVLDELYRGQAINLIPRSNQLALTEAERAAALWIGGESKHLISIHPNDWRRLIGGAR
jgi:hypothetical protein